MTMHYVSFYVRDFARARLVVKRRASRTVVLTASITATIAVLGAAVTITGWNWLGLVTTGLAGAAGVLGAWDRHFRHKELWEQRSLVLGQLQELKRDLELAKSDKSSGTATGE